MASVLYVKRWTQCTNPKAFACDQILWWAGHATVAMLDPEGMIIGLDQDEDALR